MQAEAQTTIFDAPEPTPAERAKLTRLEGAIDRVCDVLGQGFADNEIVVVKKIAPDKAATYADKLGLIRKALAQLETALRRTAVQTELTT